MCYEVINNSCFELKRGNSKIVPANSKSKTTYRLVNPNQKIVSKITFDLCKGPNESCCDHLFIVENSTKHRYIFVELKSSDVLEATKQLLTSIRNYQACLANKIIDGRIVTTKTFAPNLIASEYQRLRKFLRAKGGDLKTKSQTLEEEI